MCGRNLYADVRSVELVKLFELLVRNLLVGRIERVLKLRSGILFIVTWVLSLHRMRGGHILVGGVERLHGLYRWNVHDLDRRVVVLELCRGEYLGRRRKLLCELRGRDISAERRRLELCCLRSRHSVGLRRSNCVNRVRGLHGGLVFGFFSKLVHILRRRELLGGSFFECVHSLPFREFLLGGVTHCRNGYVHFGVLLCFFWDCVFRL